MSFPSDMDVALSDGWSARLELGFERRGELTVLGRKRQIGPLTVQRPFYPEGGACHLYLLHPPGGVVGGDGLEVEAHVGEGAHALITTPGAAKFYRSAGPRALQHQRFVVDGGGVLEWLPNENILFPGAMMSNQVQVELAGDAVFLGWEIQCLGRPAIGERFDAGRADLRLAVHRDGRPLLAERLRLRGGSDLDGPSGLRGFPVNATFVGSGAGTEDLAAVREGLEAKVPKGALFATTLVEDLLVARCLAASVESARRTFVALWGILRPRLLGREACPPRIWAT